MKKIRVLHIGTSGGRGGIESFILNMCSRLNKDRYQFTIIADCEKAEIEQDFKKLGGKVVFIPAIVKDKKGYIKGLWNSIDRNKYDVVHIHKNSLSNPLPVLFCEMKGIRKVILHSHNTLPANKNASEHVHKFFRVIISRMPIKKLACSEKAGEWMFGSDYRKKGVKLFKNGIDTGKFSFNPEIRQNVRETLGLDGNAVAFCNVGRLSEQKNTLFLIKIFDRIYEKKPQSHLFLIGKGVLEEEARKLADSMKCGSNVHFLGIRSDIAELYQGMDMFLMPSLYEGLPIAGVEAQASGLPMLISDTVDREIKICRYTEFEKLGSSAEKWAEHAVSLLEKSERTDCRSDIIKAGYDINSSASVLDKIYRK